MTGTTFKNASGWPIEGQWTTARDIAVLAWHTIKDFPQYYHYYSETELDLQQHQAAEPQPTAQDHAGHRRAEDRPHGGGRLRPGDLGGARRPAPDPGGERPHLDGRARAGNGAADRVGLPRIGQHDGLPRRRYRRRGAGVARHRRTRCRWSSPRRCRSRRRPARPAEPRVVARFDGPLPAPIVKGTTARQGRGHPLPDGRVVEYPLESRRRRAAHGRGRPRHGD